jgi:hypothetical protein
MSQYFTFGFGQGHDNGYVEVTENEFGEARRIMRSKYGNRWGFQYSETEFKGQVERWALIKVDTLTGIQTDLFLNMDIKCFEPSRAVLLKKVQLRDKHNEERPIQLCEIVIQFQGKKVCAMSGDHGFFATDIYEIYDWVMENAKGTSHGQT